MSKTYFQSCQWMASMGTLTQHMGCLMQTQVIASKCTGLAQACKQRWKQPKVNEFMARMRSLQELQYVMSKCKTRCEFCCCYGLPVAMKSVSNVHVVIVCPYESRLWTSAYDGPDWQRLCCCAGGTTESASKVNQSISLSVTNGLWFSQIHWQLKYR